MPGKQLTGLTCKAVVEKAALKVDCCEDCHNYTNPDFGNHRLHFANWSFMKDGTSTELYICCNVDKALSRPQKKHQKYTVQSASSTNGIQWTANVVSTSSMVGPAKVLSDEELATQLTSLANSAKQIEEKLTAQEEALVHKIGQAYQKKLHPPQPWKKCGLPMCVPCMADPNRYWSYKLQEWIPKQVYHEVNALHGLDLTHPLMPFAEGHVCAPGAEVWPNDQKVHIPEFSAWMCNLPDGKPTFGLKYCVNPVYMAAVKGNLGDGLPAQLILGIPDGEKVTDWIPTQYAAYITNVVYLPQVTETEVTGPQEIPPF